MGFFIATASLHAVGVGLGHLMEGRHANLLRWSGGAIAAVGVLLIVA